MSLQVATPIESILITEQNKPGLLPEDSLAEAGKKIWSFQLLEMLSHEEGTQLGEDIEALHDMRVSTRRMRAAFDVFGEAFKPKKLKPHLAGLRATGRALGKVRDLDVFVEKARKYLSELPELEQNSLEPLLESWASQRESARLEMLDYLNGNNYSRFKEKFSAFLVKPEQQGIQRKDSLPNPHQIKHLAPILIYRNFAGVRCYDTILEHASIEQHHALRIAFKKFRYTVEFFKEILDPRAQVVIDDLKKMQDHLGDLNDADVAAKMMKNFLEKLETSQNKLPVIQRINSVGTMQYQLYCQSERHQLLTSFPEVWNWFNRVEFRQNLSQAVSIL